MQKLKMNVLVESVGEIETYGANGFQKRQMIAHPVDENPNYPNPIPFVATKDNCALLDDVKAGQVMTVTFVINGRKWDGPNGTRYFQDNSIFSIVPMTAAAPAVAAPNAAAVAKAADGAAQKVLGCSMETFLAEWAKVKGVTAGQANAAMRDPKSDLTAFRQQTVPGKTAKQYGAGDWAACVNALKALPTDDEMADIPF